MKLPLLLTTLLLSASPALANKAYIGGVFLNDDYVMTYNLLDNSDSRYSVSVVEARSVRRNRYTVPSSFSFDCRSSEGSAYLAMGPNRPEDFSKEVFTYYFLNSVLVLDINMKIIRTNEASNPSCNHTLYCSQLA